ncbi:MAG: BON domain-containing protein [Thermoguttaceae bacterium]|nr:BON domain-containing protein [Thermoguttaceae bacterium]
MITDNYSNQTDLEDLKMRRFFATALIAMTAVCAPLAFGGNQEEANRIAKTISAAYPQYSVEVAYKSGRVRLRGEVASPAERQHITQLVSQFPGVQSVSADSLQIAPEIDGAVSTGDFQTAASQVLPAVPTAETPAIPGTYAAAPLMGGNAISPVSGEFNMNSSLETAPLQSLPANTASFQNASNPENFRIDNYSAAPVASGNYSTNNMNRASYTPAPNETIYAQNGYSPAPQGVPVAAGRYGQNGEPNLPNYAWPTTADYPNYAQVGYPKQYAASAFPYIGPFYPYPQVPLGWRKVTMEWHDGYWWLDFNDGSVNGPFSPLFRQPTKYR